MVEGKENGEAFIFGKFVQSTFSGMEIARHISNIALDWLRISFFFFRG
jgi:hypothetical protein